MKRVFKLSRLWFPTILLSLSYSVWVSLYYLPHAWRPWLPNSIPNEVVFNISHTILLLAVYGVIASLINLGMDVLEEQHKQHTMLASLPSLRRDQQQTMISALWSLSRGVKGIIFLIITYQSISNISLFSPWQHNLYQGIRIVITGLIGWCVFQLMHIGEILLLQYFPVDARRNIDARRRYTHIAIIKRILILLLVIITLAVMLMSFEKIRVAGTAILASAGVFSTVVIFSARGLLESIFKGVQLAISQPVRLEDTVTINGEIGTVTSISLQHVVVTLSDRSQLIVPVSDLLDKTFKNWTHVSENLMANVVFYVKYNTPIEAVRHKFQEYLKASEFWDQGIGELRVSDLKNNLIEIKFIVSAKSGKALAKLRNELLEKLLHYMQEHHPGSLP